MIIRIPWRLFLLIGILPLIGLSCPVRISSTKSLDGGVYRTADNGSTWQQRVFINQQKGKITTIGGIGIKQLIISPLNSQVLYATADRDGVYVSENSGERWQQIYKSSAQALAVHPTIKHFLLVASDNRIMRLQSETAQWETVYLESTPKVSITDITIDENTPNIVYAGTSKGGLLKSDDSGTRWQPVYFFKERVAKVFVNLDSNGIYVALTSGGLWRSGDNGVSWVDIRKTLTDQIQVNLGSYRALTILPDADDGVLFVTQRGIFRTVSGGESWEELKLLTPPGGVNISAVAAGPEDDTDIYYAVSGTFYRSHNAGVSWETVALPTKQSPTSIVLDENDKKVLYIGFSK